MQPTRRTWTAAAIGAVLAVVGPVVASPLPVVGAAVVFGWILARQLVAVWGFQATVEATTLTVEPSVSRLQVGTDVPVTLTVERPPTAADTVLTVLLSLPPAATPRPERDREVSLAVGETRETTTVLLSIPTAGRMTIKEPTWEICDTHAMFTESFDRGPTPTVTVEAQTIQDLHVGRGGSELSAFGQHPTEGTGDGVTPAELRQYLDGDPADRIDWKATARLSKTYVREFEAESDREITLIVDHRSQMAAGSIAETQLDFAREVALGIVSNAESVGDPLGLITVGDDGLTTTLAATRQQIGYARIREQLLALEPTPAGRPSSSVDLQHPGVTQRLAQQLAGDTTAFGQTLRAFTETATGYVERIETDPLYGAVDYLQATTNATQLTIILTTDRERSQLRETVRAAASDGNAVLVFLTPQVLFEAFRTELERLGPVIAYEVGPGDRLSTLLSSGASGTATRATGGGQ